MNFDHLLLFSYMILASQWSSSAIDVQPETIIPITISDLLPRHLTRDYAIAVAKIIESQRSKIRECLNGGGVTQLKYALTLSLSSTGHVRSLTTESVDRLEEANSLIVQCIGHTLTRARFPTHSLPNDVLVKIPIQVTRLEQ